LKYLRVKRLKGNGNYRVSVGLLIQFTKQVRVTTAEAMLVITRAYAPSTISQLVAADLPTTSAVVGEAL